MKLVGAIALVVLAGSAGCVDNTRNESVNIKKKGSELFEKKQYQNAVDKYDQAVKKWSDNHLAWYEMSLALIHRKDWAKAADAAGNAVKIVPEQPMYQLNYGDILRMKAIEGARQEQATKENKKPEEIELDLSNVNFEKALLHLQEAAKLNSDMWRAHYLIGTIKRDTGHPKEAAAAFTKACEAAPLDRRPWIALAELYRQWDYTDQAIQVAEQAAAVIFAESEKSDVWYEVGMGYDDKRLDDKAIDALDKALKANSANHLAKFARGQVYFRKGDYARAKQDLEEFSRSGGRSVEFFKQQASRMLGEIAAKSATPPAGGAPSPDQKLSPEEMIKKSKGEKRG